VPSITYAGKWLFVEGMPIFAWFMLLLVFVLKLAYKCCKGAPRSKLATHVSGSRSRAAAPKKKGCPPPHPTQIYATCARDAAQRFSLRLPSLFAHVRPNLAPAPAPAPASASRIRTRTFSR
jgi:hypothetical protein